MRTDQRFVTGRQRAFVHDRAGHLHDPVTAIKRNQRRPDLAVGNIRGGLINRALDPADREQQRRRDRRAGILNAVGADLKRRQSELFVVGKEQVARRESLRVEVERAVALALPRLKQVGRPAARVGASHRLRRSARRADQQRRRQQQRGAGQPRKRAAQQRAPHSSARPSVHQPIA